MTLVLKFAGAEQRFRPADGDVNLGRAPDNQIVIPIASVSRKHARIVWHADGAPYLVNLSSNGSSVRFRISGMETPCASEVRLEGTGDIAFCASFALAGSPNELVYFRLVSA
jgi:FHA domain